jgi:hypothetical protein
LRGFLTQPPRKSGINGTNRYRELLTQSAEPRESDPMSVAAAPGSEEIKQHEWRKPRDVGPYHRGLQ